MENKINSGAQISLPKVDSPGALRFTSSKTVGYGEEKKKIFGYGMWGGM